jgi:hypothetical protein
MVMDSAQTIERIRLKRLRNDGAGKIIDVTLDVRNLTDRKLAGHS